jgi:hypothetical protein
VYVDIFAKLRLFLQLNKPCLWLIFITLPPIVVVVLVAAVTVVLVALVVVIALIA